jgi:hypothetical protein
VNQKELRGCEERVVRMKEDLGMVEVQLRYPRDDGAETFDGGTYTVGGTREAFLGLGLPASKAYRS